MQCSLLARGAPHVVLQLGIRHIALHGDDHKLQAMRRLFTGLPSTPDLDCARVNSQTSMVYLYGELYIESTGLLWSIWCTARNGCVLRALTKHDAH